MEISSDPARSLLRREQLERYMSRQVLSPDGAFRCQHYAACRSSHEGTFFEGQLHHVGRHYDLLLEGRPFRVVVAGQEYAGGPPCVSPSARYQQVYLHTGLETTLADRNPHMQGTTHLLRLLVGLGADHGDEFLTLGGERHHLFDAFALANYLLCSAHRGSSAEGCSTPTMRRNCRGHFREAMAILQPTVMVVQGKGFWPAVRRVFDSLDTLAPDVYLAWLAGHRLVVAALAHPSARGAWRWGAVRETSYLRDSVIPAVRSIHRYVLQDV